MQHSKGGSAVAERMRNGRHAEQGRLLNWPVRTRHARTQSKDNNNNDKNKNNEKVKYSTERTGGCTGGGTWLHWWADETNDCKLTKPKKPSRVGSARAVFEFVCVCVELLLAVVGWSVCHFRRFDAD